MDKSAREAKQEEAKSLAALGFTLQHIANSLGVSKSTAKRWVDGYSERCQPYSESYQAKHQRVLAARGFARNYSCVDCDDEATNWSQTSGTDGLDPKDYSPRCFSCHIVYDNNHLRIGQYAKDNAKLSQDDIEYIRSNPKGLSGKGLAELFSVSPSRISVLRNEVKQ